MIRITLLFVLCAFVSIAFAADTYVKSYTKSNGTVVQGHYRSAPNSTVDDNYSSYGNSNPYTGAIGTAKVYQNTNDRTIYTGPRGGRYYINENGKKVYVDE